MNTINEVSKIKKTIKAIRDTGLKSYIEKPYTRISGYTTFPLQIEGSLSDYEKECVCHAIEATVNLILNKASRAMQITAKRLLREFTNGHLQDLEKTVVRRKRGHKQNMKKQEYNEVFLGELKKMTASIESGVNK